MDSQQTIDVKDKTLNELLNDWKEGKLTEEEKDYVVSKVPIMAYVHRKEDSGSDN